MKNIIYFFLIFILASCSKKFLEIFPETTLNEGNFYKTESDFINLANGCYVPMRDNEKTNHWRISEFISDNGTKQYNPTTGDVDVTPIDQFLITAENRSYSGFWDLSYNGITRCNKLLFEINNRDISWSDISLKDRCIGEALFLRGLYYFNLVRQYGGIPLVLTSITSQESVGIKRSTEEVVYESIVSDLKQAVIHFSNAESVKENGRANLGAANALLGKVYLTLKDYNDAKTVLESVINSGNYVLLSNYTSLFDPTNKDFKETIFAIQYSENTAELSNSFIFSFAPWNSKGKITTRANVNISGSGGYNVPTQELIDAFEPGDVRKDVSIKYWTGPDWDNVVRSLPYCAKYKPPVSAPDNRCGDNLPVIRYSDVLLMYAEVLNNLGNTGQAIPYIEKVRNRAGLMNPLTGYDKLKLDSLIAKERQKEFCFENQRWYDLKRTGKAIEVMNAQGARLKAAYPFLPANSYELNANMLLAPIPGQQVLLNKIEQNPGY